MIVVFTISTVILIYALGVAMLLYSWREIPVYPKSELYLPKVSVVIAFRNESARFPALLAALAKQNYPVTQLEIILVNDHSEDAYKQRIEECSMPFRLTILNLDEVERGKKMALSKGVGEATGEWILTSDADCSMGSEWVTSMLAHAKQSGATFVFGPVCFRQEGAFLYNFQSIELSSLIGSGAALWNMGYPTMCNGANLLYKKEIVAGKNVYQDTLKLASGDDEFLMHRVFAENSNAVSFVKDTKSIVETEACENWKSFFQQRRRWASKWGAYRLFHVKMIALLVFFVNVCYALLPFSLLWDENLTPWVLVAYLLRWFIDAIFLNEILCFSKKPFNLVSYLKLAIIYPYYVVYSGLAGRTGKYEWKGRTVS